MLILVIDDDGLAGDMAAAIVNDCGHQALLADSAAQALVLLEQHAGVALIVCDLHMPDMDGIDLLRHLRARGCALPFMLLSGDAPPARLRAEPGIAAWLLKDAALEQSLRRAIEENKA
jgi:CheY-like chemotaxis protein